jgi:Xaa-Pro aminopeptidase
MTTAPTANAPVTSSAALVARRARLSRAFGRPALFASGGQRARNYAANGYPFRAASHFLYFAGAPLVDAMLLVTASKSTLFVVPAGADDALWHGEHEPLEALAARTGVDAIEPISSLPDAISALARSGEVATLPPQDEPTASALGAVLGRRIEARGGTALEGIDARLADAVIDVRLEHDEPALTQMRAAVAVTTRAHASIFRTLAPEVSEARVRAGIECEFTAAGMSPAYGSIVSVHGEILHAERSDGVCRAGELLLVDAGAESAEGWASDVTRVYPVTGRFSPSQRAIYDIVLAANRAVIAAIAPGKSWRALHRLATRTIVEGLVELRILRGSVEGLLERNAGGLFFPHGLGHLIGLDVHDMEDLGDRAGYAPGRTRLDGLGERYLRLDRELAVGMGVTVEPGFYQVPAILRDPRFVGPIERDLDRARLAEFADVRGIRLEDDVVVTEHGADVLTSGIPIAADDVEAAFARA